MSHMPGSLMLCFIWTFVTHSQGMLFLLDTGPDSIYCGRLHCWADTIFTESNVFSVSGLTVYDITNSAIAIKLAFLSVYDPVSVLEQTHINVTATGNISRYHAELTLGLRDHSFCLNRSFMCELDFVHFNGNPDKSFETITQGSSGNCPAVFNQFAQVAIQVKTHSDELEKKNVELEEEVVTLKTELDKGTHGQVMCFKGLTYNNSRHNFLLWDKVEAVCDTETDGGGWIIIQSRTKGDVDFYRGWNDYKYGFGTRDTDFWIGNNIIHNLTSQGFTELRIDMEYQERHYFAQYSYFSVASETSLYRLSVSGYDGTANDSLTYHDGRYFSTFDKDNDPVSENCASHYHGAWWYNACYESSLNGLWGAQNSTGVCWQKLVASISVSMSEIKVRHA